MLQKYYQLTKPGIVYGNALTATAGFLFASKWHDRWGLLLVTVAGIGLIIAAACVVNNYLDRNLDAKMARTKGRALVRGAISSRQALIYAAILGLAGSFLLLYFTNRLTFIVTLFGFIIYVLAYGIAKRRSVHGTIIGSLAGAVPPVAGYCAISGRLDSAALLLFLILICWQMPHFYAIAIYRYRDYEAAKLPVLPVVKGIRQTKIQIMAYIVAFVIVSLLPSAFGYTGYCYVVVMAGVGLSWLYIGAKGFRVADEAAWARKVFLYSLVVTIVLSVMLSLGPILP